jgi:hypothetical protein
VEGQVIHKFTNHQFPLKTTCIFLKEPVVKYQKGRIMFPVYACEEREKISRQNGKNPCRHLSTVCKEVLFVKAGARTSSKSAK